METAEIIKGRASPSAACHLDWSARGSSYNSSFLHYHPSYLSSSKPEQFRTKISVGSNPWAPRPRTHNIAEICERYGGGGHAVVGAVSLKPEDVELGRQYAKEIIEELQFAD